MDRILETVRARWGFAAALRRALDEVDRSRIAHYRAKREAFIT